MWLKRFWLKGQAGYAIPAHHFTCSPQLAPCACVRHPMPQVDASMKDKKADEHNKGKTDKKDKKNGKDGGDANRDVDQLAVTKKV